MSRDDNDLGKLADELTGTTISEEIKNNLHRGIEEQIRAWNREYCCLTGKDVQSLTRAAVDAALPIALLCYVQQSQATIKWLIEADDIKRKLADQDEPPK